MRSLIQSVILGVMVFIVHAPAFADKQPVRVAIRTDSPPFSYLVSNDSPSDINSYRGYVADICRKVLAEFVRSEVVVIPVYSGGNRFEAIENGSADVHCGPVSATSSRLGQFISSQPVFLSGTTYALGATNGVPVGRPLKIGFLENTTALKGVEELELREHFGSRSKGVFEEISRALAASEARFQFKHLGWFNSHNEGLRALCLGDIDYYVGDIDILTYHANIINKDENCNLVVARRTITREIYIILFSSINLKRKPDYMANLILAFQKGVHEMFQDGSIKVIFEDNLRDKSPSQELQSFFNSFSRRVKIK